ncbi:DUF4868 domain-containing protein [Staphylococcus pseudintermedius]|nr:DUF4868 domain-containing protein [Staphylococcus pseudintermedius]
MNLDYIFYKLKDMDDQTRNRSVKFNMIKESDNSSDILLYNVEVESSVQESLFNVVYEFLNHKKRREKEQKEYDAIMQHNHFKGYYCIENDKYNGVKKFDELLKNDKLESTSGYDINDFFAYCIEICICNTETFYYVGQITALSKLSKTKLIGNITDKKLKRINNDELFGINNNMGFVSFNSEFLINQISIFEKYTQMNSEFVKSAKDFVKVLSEMDVIENIDEMKLQFETDSIIARRLSKLSEYPDRVKNFFDNKEEINKVLESDEFKDKFKGIKYVNGKLLYDNEYRNQFITLISDSAYESIVGKEKRIDETL